MNFFQNIEQNELIDGEIKMNLSEIARNKAYWMLDAIKGHKVRNYLDVISKYNSGAKSKKEIEIYQKKCICELLNHCVKTVPYYQKMDTLELEEWPVITKSTIKENRQAFISQNYEEKDLISMSTSGSTGTPFVSLQNIEKKKHVNAETMYYMGLLNYKVGQRIIFLRSLVEECAKTNLQQFAQNIYQINCNDLSDSGIENKLKEIEKLSKTSGAFLIAYSSTYETFRKYFERNGYESAKKCKILGMVAGSEMLYDATRKSMEKAFNCKCVSRYANEENGFLGQDLTENNVFLVDVADYYIEILKFDSDEKAENGEVGRIVVTDLFNYGLPMVRYDTGDVGAFTYIEVEGKKHLAIGSFGGRAVDVIFDCYGKQLSPHAITNAMWRFQSLKQFKFIQKEEKVYEIQLNTDCEKIDEELLEKEIKNVVGLDSVLKISYVNEIPVLASGKRRYIENQWRK